MRAAIWLTLSNTSQIHGSRSPRPLAKRTATGHHESMNDLDTQASPSPATRASIEATSTPFESASPVTNFTLFAVFRVSSSHPSVADGRDVPGLVQELEDVTEMLANEDVTVRGWYDVSGLRHDADLLVRLDGDAPEDLQWGLRELRRTAMLKPLIRVSGAVGFTTYDSARTDTEDAHLWVAVAERSLLDVVVAEADELADLLAQLVELPTEPFIGRYIEPVEIVEVLQ